MEAAPVNVAGFNPRLIERLQRKAFRDAYVAEHVRTGLAYQINALRQQRSWSQADLGRRAGKPQNVISRLEDPDYGRLGVQTLLEIAAAFDVALLVRFVSHEEILKWTTDVSPTALEVPSFADNRINKSAAATQQLGGPLRPIVTAVPQERFPGPEPAPLVRDRQGELPRGNPLASTRQRQTLAGGDFFERNPGRSPTPTKTPREHQQAAAMRR